MGLLRSSSCGLLAVRAGRAVRPIRIFAGRLPPAERLAALVAWEVYRAVRGIPLSAGVHRAVVLPTAPLS